MLMDKYNRKRRLVDDDQVTLKAAVLQALLLIDVPRNVGATEVNVLADEFVQAVDLSLRAAAGDEPF
jgi:hypothetical protein